MKVLLKYCGIVAGFLKWSLLTIQSKGPVIKYFECEYNVAINDLPQFIKWKTKHAWKVEIEGMGKVKRKDKLIFNNINLKKNLTLIAFGRKGTSVKMILDFNLKQVILEKEKPLTFITLKEKSLPAIITTGLIKNQIKQMENLLQISFYACQDCSIAENILQTIVTPQRIEKATDEISELIKKYAGNQKIFFEENYEKELNHHIQNKN